MPVSRAALEINPSPKELDGFHQWLLDNGRSSLTAAQYKATVFRVANHHGGIAARLTDKKPAPKTLHAAAAALKSYATYTEDGDLLVAIKRIRLPASRRATPRVELALEAWSQLITAIEDDKKLRPEMRATLMIMALRGLRVGDALRLKRTEIEAAIRTKRLGFEAKGRSRLEYGITDIADSLREFLSIDKPWDRVVDLVAWSSKKTGDAKMHVARLKVLQQLQRVAATIELDDVYNHRLRRTYATHFLRKLKGDPQALIKLQRHMGWATVTTAMGYVDAVDADELEDVGAELIASVRKKPTKRKR